MTDQKLLLLVAGTILLAAFEATSGSSVETRSNDGEWRQGYLEGSIQSNPHLRHSRIDIATDGGNVRLAGLVRSPAAKALAEEIALSAPGVTGVENRIEIIAIGTGAAGFDLEEEAQHLSNVPINNKVMARLLSHSSTRDLKVTAETRNRVVVVKGEVGSELEKELVFWLVKNTDGVKEVVDKIEVTLPHQIQAGLQ